MNKADKDPTGSGVLLWEMHRSRKTGRIGLAVILFGSMRKSGYYYSDCGGGLDKGENVKVGALRELLEESCNLFSLTKDHLTVSVRTKNYVCFNVFIHSQKGELSCDAFSENLTIIKDAKGPHSWRETKSIRRFFIEDLIKLKIQDVEFQNFNANTTFDENVVIHPRCVGVIQKVLKQNILDLQNQIISIPAMEISLHNYKLRNGSKLDFLIGTKTFLINNFFQDIDASTAYQLQIQQDLKNHFNNNNQQNNNQLQMDNNLNNQMQIEQINQGLILQNQNQQNQQNLFQDRIQNYRIINKELLEKINNPKNQRRGGGIILIATIENNEQGILLVRDRKDICSDMGGSSSDNELTIMEAALREAKEETSNTFNIQESQLNQTHSIRIQNYVCYVLHISINLNELQDLFSENLNKLLGLGDDVPRCWKGKKQIIFFPFSKCTDYFNQFDINAKKFEMNDLNGNSYVIRDRTAIIINEIIKNKIHLNLPIHQTKIQDNSSHSFIINPRFSFISLTSSYLLA